MQRWSWPRSAAAVSLLAVLSAGVAAGERREIDSAGALQTSAQKCVRARWQASASFEERVSRALVKFGPLGSDDTTELERIVREASARFEDRLRRIETTFECPEPFDLPAEMFRILRSRDLVATNDRIGGGLGTDVLNRLLGDCHDAASAPTIGCASIDGEIAGRSLAPVSTITGEKPFYVFVFTRLETRHTAIAISDFPDWCGSFTSLGRTLYVSLFENPTLPVSTVSGPGTFAVWLPDLNGQVDPGTGNVAIVLFAENTNAGGSGQLADSGTVTVEEVSAGEIAGKLDVTIGGERVTGHFRAPTCAPWTRAGDIPAPLAPGG